METAMLCLVSDILDALDREILLFDVIYLLAAFILLTTKCSFVAWRLPTAFAALF